MREGWVETTFGDIFKIVAGKYVAKEEYVEGGEFWIYGSNSIMGKIDRFLVEQSHVVMAAIGAYAGAVRYSKEPSWINNNAMALVPSEKVMAKYLHLWLESKFDLKRVVVGTGQPYVQRPLLLKELIALPPLPEQKRIVDLISSVDSYIKALEHQLVSARSASNAQLEKIISEFNDDWVEVALGEVLEISRGGSPRPIQEYLTDSQDGINWVKIADATRSEKYIYSTLQKIKKEGISRSREVFSGDFILSNSMSFGRPYIMRTDGCIHDGWLLLSKVSNRFDEDFLYNLLNSNYVQRQFESMAAGSGVRNLNIEVVKKVKVKIPTIEVQKELASVINEFDNFIIKLTRQLHSGMDLRQALLSDLLSGDHEIPASYDKVIGAA